MTHRPGCEGVGLVLGVERDGVMVNDLDAGQELNDNSKPERLMRRTQYQHMTNVASKLIYTFSDYLRPRTSALHARRSEYF